MENNVEKTKQQKVTSDVVEEQKTEREDSAKKELFPKNADITREQTVSNLDDPLAFLNSEKESTVENISIDQGIRDQTDEPNNDEVSNEVDSPSIVSQFSNLVTITDSTVGVRKKPRRLLKKPKITYAGRHKKHTTGAAKTFKHRQIVFAPKQSNVEKTQEEFDVFEFQLSGKETDRPAPSKVSKVSTENVNNDINKEIKPSSPSLNVHRNRRKRRKVSFAEEKKEENHINISGLSSVAIFLFLCS